MTKLFCSMLYFLSVPFANAQSLNINAKDASKSGKKNIFKHSIKTSVRIHASPEKVWDILSDLSSWEQWNPFMIKASGEVKVGNKLNLTFHAPGMSAMKMSPTVQWKEDKKGFGWLGSLGMKGIFDGTHNFELVQEGDFTILYHSEKFSGILIPFMRKKLNVNTKEGFEKMNEALKNRCEH